MKGLFALKPEDEVKWLKLLSRNRKVPGSNLGPETGNPEVFVVLLSPARQMPGSYLESGHDQFLPNLLQFIIYLPFFHPTLYSLSY
jgi:hypothetical protein